MTAKFDSRDPLAPAFWSERFEKRFTPWDRGDVPQSLRDFVARSPEPRETLIPGCGTGYEAVYLSEAGWNVTAIDFSEAAVAAARNAAGKWANRIVTADFFSFTPERPPQLIYERAFLCALPPERWPAVVQRWSELLAPGAFLAGFFYFDKTPKGPPFGASEEQLHMLLAPAFEQIEDAAVADSVQVFAGKERWQVWRRR